MEVVKITEEQMELLSNSIRSIVKIYSFKREVKAIYMIASNKGLNSYIDPLEQKGINIAIGIIDDGSIIKEHLVEVEAIKTLISNDIGINLFVERTPSDYFNQSMITSWEKNAGTMLANATILFDRTGNYKLLQKNLKKNSKKYQDVLIFDPPLQMTK